ncbi:MAG: hypothetical protein KDI55_17370, partial [Anaerolineae bacterium]|nr:hypothetical protein [Anaerolineae bacterium]
TTGLLPLKYPPFGNPATSEVCVDDFQTVSQSHPLWKVAASTSVILPDQLFAARKRGTAERLLAENA